MKTTEIKTNETYLVKVLGGTVKARVLDTGILRRPAWGSARRDGVLIQPLNADGDEDGNPREVSSREVVGLWNATHQSYLERKEMSRQAAKDIAKRFALAGITDAEIRFDYSMTNPYVMIRGFDNVNRILDLIDKGNNE